MKRIMLLSFLAIMLCAIPAKAAPSYVNGIDANYPPFAYVDEKTGKPTGFDVDSLNWIANKMGFMVTHTPIAWDGIIPALLARQIDMVYSGMSITEKRAQMVTFTNPYWRVERVFVVANSSKLKLEDMLTKPINLGTQRGTSEADKIANEQKEKKYPFTLRHYESAPLIVKDLLNGRLQAGFMEALPAIDAISKGSRIKILGSHGEVNTFGVATRKDDEELRKLLNEGIKLLMADPYWQALQDKYLGKK